MSLLGRLPDAVEIVRPKMGVDEYDNPVRDWGAPLVTETRGWLQQTTTSESDGPDRSPLVTGWALYLPAGTDLVARDRVRVNGLTFEVDGAPYAPRGLGTVRSHLKAILRKVEG